MLNGLQAALGRLASFLCLREFPPLQFQAGAMFPATASPSISLMFLSKSIEASTVAVSEEKIDNEKPTLKRCNLLSR